MAIVITLLQLALTLLVSAQQSPNIDQVLRDQTVSTANQAISLANSVLGQQNFGSATISQTTPSPIPSSRINEQILLASVPLPTTPQIPPTLPTLNQQIQQNTVPVSIPLPDFVFNPEIHTDRLTGATDYIYIPESFDDEHITVKISSTNQVLYSEYPGGGKIIGGKLYINYCPYNKICEVDITLNKKGFNPAEKKIQVKGPVPKITVEKRIKPWPSQPDMHGEFFFWHTSGNEEGSVLNFGIKVELKNSEPPNKLTFYKAGIAFLYKEILEVKDGDIIRIENFISGEGSLVWSFSGNPDNLLLMISDGTATNKNGINIPFVF